MTGREPITKFQRMLEKNKADKLAFLNDINITQVATQFNESVERVASKPEPRPRASKIKWNVSKPSLPMPTRKSRRIESRSSHLSLDSLKEDQLKEIDKDLPSDLTFEQALCEGFSYDKYIKTYSQHDYAVKTKVNHYADYITHLENMSNSAEIQICKLVFGRITALDIHPAKNFTLVCAGSKYGSLGFWNVDLKYQPFLFNIHSGGITHLKFIQDLPNLIITSSYDGTVRQGDLEKNIFNKIYEFHGGSCTYFALMSSSTSLVAQSDGSVAIVDNRCAKKTMKQHKCHTYSCKTVDNHPLDDNIFVTASKKGSVKIWDLRNLQSDPLIDIDHHRRSANSAFFSQHTGNYLLTTSLDDTICIFDCSSRNAVKLQKCLKHNNFTGRWLSIFRATWLHNSDDIFVIGSMESPRRIEIFNRSGVMHKFQNEKLNTVTSLNIFHPYKPLLVGGNSSGKAFVFSQL